MTVKERAVRLATFRHVEVRLMETLARWVPSTPEMEAKVLFGQHIWDHAQHADSLGRRTQELRAPLHHALPPAPEYAGALALLDGILETPRRIHGYHGIFLPGIERRYRAYLDATDILLDAPSVRIVTAILLDIGRMILEGRELCARLSSLASTATEWAGSLAAAEGAALDLVAPCEPGAAASGEIG
jgi:hypothetical protein